MKIFIAGGTGFVGTALVKRLVEKGHEVTVMIRSEEKRKRLPPGVSAVFGSTVEEGTWQDQIRHHEVVINLAGKNIFSRWTTENKRQIWESRIFSTRNIINALKSGAHDKKTTLINASAVGYFGFCRDEEKTENANPGNDFLARLCVDWEDEAIKAQEIGCRVVLARIGIVLGPGGGALHKMMPIFKAGLGGRLGNGRQWFPWIHLDDMVEAILFVMSHEEVSGPVNCCSPYPVRNRELTAALAKSLNRPAIMPVPTFMVKLVFGELSGVLLKGCKVMPGILTKNDFHFQCPDIETALKDIFLESK